MKISRKNKIVITILVGVLAFLMFAGAFLEWMIPRYKDTQEVYYSYASKGNIDYKVCLKPSPVFETESLGEDRYYISKYIDRIEMEFIYDYVGSFEADTVTQYSVTARLQGLFGPDNEVLWSKDYILVPQKTENNVGREVNIVETTSIDLLRYFNLNENLKLESEVNTPVVLNVEFNVHTQANTGSGTLEDTINPVITIPIGENVFRIDGNPMLTGEKKIEKQSKELLPVNTSKIITLFVISIMFITVLVLVYRMDEADPMDEFEKTVSGIFREYGERMAGMDHAISYLLTDVINVNCIDDMVKIADEVGQPVFYYKAESRSERKIEFYVFDSNRTYYMVLFGEISNENMETE